jgi:hypothetical protein
MRDGSGFFTDTAIFSLLSVVVFFTSAKAEAPKKPRSLCEVRYPSDAAIEWDCRKLKAGESLETLFGDRWIDLARFNRIDRRHVRPGTAIKVPRRLNDIGFVQPLPRFYQPAEQEEQFLLIDLAEQFLGAYEYGALQFSLPIASGEPGNETPSGEFRITAAHRKHESCLYSVEGTDRPYPMNYALRFHVNREGTSYWIHGRDLPGYPASHGCIGLYDEPMQKEQYGVPKDPELTDAKRLYEWVLGGEIGDDRMIPLRHGPRVVIIGEAPKSERP